MAWDSAFCKPRESPLNVVHLETIVFPFYYDRKLELREKIVINNFEDIPSFPDEAYLFELEKIAPGLLKLLCKRQKRVQTEDDGYFLRLYITLAGVREGIKTTVLRSQESSTHVNFSEINFFHEEVHLNTPFVFKCTFRRIETNILYNKLLDKQKLMLQDIVLWACNDSQKADMAFVLKRPDIQGICTGREIQDFSQICQYIRRACIYSKELVQYFMHREDAKLYPLEMKLERILGYIYFGEDTDIDYLDCRSLYTTSVYGGMIFLKEIATDYLIDNMNNEVVTDVLLIANATDDKRLVDTAFLYCFSNNFNFLESPEWIALCSEPQFSIFTRCVLHSLWLRTQPYEANFPPGLEDETAEI